MNPMESCTSDDSLSWNFMKLPWLDTIAMSPEGRKWTRSFLTQMGLARSQAPVILHLLAITRYIEFLLLSIPAYCIPKRSSTIHVSFSGLHRHFLWPRHDYVKVEPLERDTQLVLFAGRQLWCVPENRQNSDHMLMSQQHLLVLVSIGVIAQECWRTEVCMTLLYFCTSNLYLLYTCDECHCLLIPTCCFAMICSGISGSLTRLSICCLEVSSARNYVSDLQIFRNLPMLSRFIGGILTRSNVVQMETLFDVSRPFADVWSSSLLGCWELKAKGTKLGLPLNSQLRFWRQEDFVVTMTSSLWKLACI